jgi:hypothetical protein
MVNILKNWTRFIRALISFPYNKQETSYARKERIIVKKVFMIAKKIQQENKKKLNTHKIFSDKILNLIIKNKLLNFLQLSFIQQMFFIHNRLFIFFELLELYKDKNWEIWRKIIKENEVGNPVRFFLYPRSSGNKIHQAYHLKKFTQETSVDLKKFINIIEFGGGYGNMANMLTSINKKINYIIFDTKEVGLLQYYYLKRLNLDVGIGIKKRAKIILISEITDLKKKLSRMNTKNSLFIANWSLSEVPMQIRDEVFFVFKKIDYQIISYQKQFEKINNLPYFQKINRYNLIKNRVSKIIKMKHKKNNFYLFSASKN